MQTLRLCPEDAQLALSVVCAIKQPESDEAISARYLREFLSRPENVLIVASHNGDPAGFALAYILDRIDQARRMVCLYEIDVAMSHRERGVGREMIEVLKSICRDVDATKMWTVTDRSNEAAMRLYKRTGARVESRGSTVALVWSPEAWRTVE